MPTVAVYDITNKQVGDIELNENVFGVEVNGALLHQAVVMQLASQRLGTHATKTRAMVRGGGRKPWKQKGTGHARSGSNTSPVWVGGGIVFGPHPRSYAFSMPRKQRRLAIKCALSDKVQSGDFLVLDSLNFEAPKTKDFVAVLNNLKVSGKKPLFVLPGVDKNVYLSARNLKGVNVMMASMLNTYSVLDAGVVVVAEGSLSTIDNILM